MKKQRSQKTTRKTRKEIAKRFKINGSSAGRSLTTEEGLQAALQISELAAKENVDCAVCGGLAMHLYGFTRATKDIDFIASALLSLSGKQKLSFGGLVYHTKVGNKEVDVDWIVRDDFFRVFYDAALEDAEETEGGLRVVSPEWMVVLKYIARRGKDRIDMMWLLQQSGLVKRKKVVRIMERILGKQAAIFPVRELEDFFSEADLMKKRERE